jgi:hypothetical protein
MHITIVNIHIYVCLLFLIPKLFVVPEQPIFLYIFPGKNYNWRSKDNHWILLLKIIIITFARIDNRLYLIMLLHRFQPSFLIRFSVGPRTGSQVVFQYLKPELPFQRNRLIKEPPVLVNFRWDDNNDKLPEWGYFFGQFFIKLLVQSVITHGGPMKQSVRDIIFKVSINPTDFPLVFRNI